MKWCLTSGAADNIHDMLPACNFSLYCVSVVYRRTLSLNSDSVASDEWTTASNVLVKMIIGLWHVTTVGLVGISDI